MPHDTTSFFTASCRCPADCGCDGGDQGCLCDHLGSSAPAAAVAPRPARRTWLRAVAALATVGLVAACSLVQAEPANLDVANLRLSKQGAFRVSYKSESTPIPINRLHTWTLHIETPDGQPVTQAVVKVDGDMPQHLHGLPTRPRVTRELGQGDYLVEGMKFQMGGWWVMAFTVDAGGRRDVATFNLKLSS